MVSLLLTQQVSSAYELNRMDNDEYKRTRLGAMGAGSANNGAATTPNNNGSDDRQQITAGSSTGGGTTMDSLRPEMTPQQQQQRSLASEDIWEWLKLSPMVPFSLSCCCCCYCYSCDYRFPFHSPFCCVFQDISRLVLLLLVLSVWMPPLTITFLICPSTTVAAGMETTTKTKPPNGHHQQHLNHQNLTAELVYEILKF